MGDVIGNILPLALGVAISPIPIIAIILMLFSKKAKGNSMAFLVGWIAGLSIAFWIVYAIANLADVSTSSGPSKASAVIKLLFGILFLFMAFKQWRKRPKPGEEASMPKLLSAIDDFSAGKSFGLAVLLSAVNPKNLGLTLAASLAIAQGGLAAWETIVIFFIFLVIAISTVAAPVIINLIMGEKATEMLNSWKAWLAANNAMVMFILLLIFGTVLVGKGIAGL